MNDKRVLLTIGLITLVVFVAGFVFTTKNAPQPLESTQMASVEMMGEVSHDWGEIDIFGGNVERVFQIKNSGEEDLIVTNFKTSCMCTETRVIIDGKPSPVFGMHSSSGWKGVIPSGQVANVQVVFDPMAHGPEATGPITRYVSFSTNDLNNQTVELEVTGDVVKND